jgi:hypothetical protein
MVCDHEYMNISPPNYRACYGTEAERRRFERKPFIWLLTSPRREFARNFEVLLIFFKYSLFTNAQVVTDLQTSCNKVVVKLISECVRTACSHGTISYYHFVKRLMTVADVSGTSCYELVVINLLTTCYVQTVSDVLEQVVARLLALLQNDNNLFQTCQRLGTSINE